MLVHEPHVLPTLLPSPWLAAPHPFQTTPGVCILTLPRKQVGDQAILIQCSHPWMQTQRHIRLFVAWGGRKGRKGVL